MSADNPADGVDDEVLLKERNEKIEILDSLSSEVIFPLSLDTL